VAAAAIWRVKIPDNIIGREAKNDGKSAFPNSKAEKPEQDSSVKNRQNFKLMESGGFFREEKKESSSHQRTEQLLDISKGRELTAAQLADVLGLSKVGTAEKWLSGQKVIPEKSLRMLINWEKNSEISNINDPHLINLNERKSLSKYPDETVRRKDLHLQG
jgi:hypothetical protein